jgi:probable rRNA maturation factor
MIDINNKFDITINKELLENITKLYTTKDIELVVTNNKTIQQLNNKNRQKNSPTDVLSFSYDNIDILGSVVVSFDFIEKASKDFGHSGQDELTLLYIHGLLHLVGFDHEIDNGKQKTEEQKIIHKFDLPNSLTTRNEI